MKRRSFFSILIIALGFTIYSCHCACSCDKNLGCKIMTLKQADGSVILTKTFCSQTDYYTDSILQDSVVSFRIRYQSSSTRIDEKDSIYKYETVKNVKCPEGVREFEQKGYGC
jgi:hypothetical protein